MTNTKGAMSISISEDFCRTLNFSMKEGSGSVQLSPSADDFTLNMKVKQSAVSVSPEMPSYTYQPEYEYVKGDGTARINLNIEKSSFSVAVYDRNSD